MKQVTLQPGDYVRTKVMDGENYHAVARAFMNAGAKKGEYPDDYETPIQLWPFFGWSAHPKIEGLFHGNGTSGAYLNGRQLTIEQVLNATNAGKETDMHITDKLTQARDERDKVQARYEATLEEHRAAYPWLIIDEREEQPNEDMTDPANWRAGDWLICVNDDAVDLTCNRIYQVLRMDSDNDPVIDDDADKDVERYAEYFQFYSRPARAYKLTTTD